eukprot:3488001-Prymnesium_polylepis.1
MKCTTSWFADSACSPKIVSAPSAAPDSRMPFESSERTIFSVASRLSRIASCSSDQRVRTLCVFRIRSDGVGAGHCSDDARR